ncbi:MAG: hypothetical protein ABSH25_12040 [Syntrophorhabdales bacterium]|jgi:hypothetical protein
MTTEKAKDDEMKAALKELERVARLLKALSASKTLTVDRDRFKQIAAKYLENLMTEEIRKLRLCSMARSELSAAARKVLDEVNSSLEK